MIHFTFTGGLAGQPFCDAQRNPSDTYRHCPLQPEVKHIINMHGVEAICPNCLHTWAVSFITNEVYVPPTDPRAEWCPSTEPWVIELAKKLQQSMDETKLETAQ